jgi:hypothetical protein
MSIVRRKRFWVAAAILGAGTVFQALPARGCAQYYTQLTLTSFNFCSVFNCQGGTFFNLCEPRPILADCPNVTTTTQ